MKILGFGDSLTAGTPGYDPSYGGDPKWQYGYWLQTRAKNEGYTSISFYNAGYPGELAAHMKPRLTRLIQNEHFSHIIILAGSNDIGWGLPVDDIKVSITSLWNLALKSGANVVGVTVPPIATEFGRIQLAQQELNKHILSWQKDDKYTSVDIFTTMADENSLLLPMYDSGDGLHLSLEGYKLLGVEIWKKVSEK